MQNEFLLGAYMPRLLSSVRQFWERVEVLNWSILLNWDSASRRSISEVSVITQVALLIVDSSIEVSPTSNYHNAHQYCLTLKKTLK